MNAFNQLFALGITKGITCCAASGDNGATDGENNNQPNADFPASSPNVVSCGGTTASGIETVWSYNPTYGWGTGGGISSIFPEPAYQVGVVKYPTVTTPPITNLIGKRASPDIAMNADPMVGWTIYFNGRLEINGTGGTSCVAPAMAGLLGLMNLSYPNGFNTHLYNVYKKQSYCFKDITTGSNDNIANSKGVYSAGAGYDCCTGLGSIRGTYLFNALKSGL